MSKRPRVPDPVEMTFAPLGAESGRGPVELTTSGHVADVVAWIQSTGRRAPVVLVSTGQRQAHTWIDAGAISSAFPQAGVYTIRDGDLTHALADMLPPRWEVYGGGGRVYPVGIDLKGDPRTSPLILCLGPDQRGVATNRMIQHLRSIGQPKARRRESPPQKRSATAEPLASHAQNSTQGVGAIDTGTGAIELARRLMSADRAHPVVVVTNASGHKPYLDSERIAQDLGGLAEVVELRQGEASWAFTGTLPERLGVFGGAARVYPVDQGWLDDETRAPLLFCWNGIGASRITGEVIDAAFSAAHSAGLLNAPVQKAHAELRNGRVMGAMGDHHLLLRLSDGQQVIALADALRHGVPAVRLVTKGQEVQGYVQEGGTAFSRFSPVPIPDDPVKRVNGAYPDGSVVLARVIEVGELSAQVALHPDVVIWLTADPAGPALSRLIGSGDAIAVRLDATSGQLTCRLADSDEEPIAGISVIPGGPAWLLPQDLVEEADAHETPEPVPAPLPHEDLATDREAQDDRRGSVPTATPGGSGQLTALQRERSLIDRQLAAAQAELDRTKVEMAKLRRNMREADKKAKVANRQTEELANSARGIGVFDDPATQLRHEVWLNYLNRIPDAQRSSLPIADYRFGPDFLGSLERIDGVSRDKIVEVLVEVLTGLARKLSSRQLHPWRVSVTGPQETRADGGAAWRCSLQVNTPSARRLKYWQLPGGVVEFDSVGVHDEGI